MRLLRAVGCRCVCWLCCLCAVGERTIFVRIPLIFSLKIPVRARNQIDTYIYRIRQILECIHTFIKLFREAYIVSLDWAQMSFAMPNE